MTLVKEKNSENESILNMMLASSGRLKDLDKDNDDEEEEEEEDVDVDACLQ